MDMLSIAIGLIVGFVFYVVATRVMARIEQRRVIKARLARIAAAPAPKGHEYTGPRFSVRGREISE